VKGFTLCIQESGIIDAVVVADKGFYSKKFRKPATGGITLYNTTKTG